VSTAKTLMLQARAAGVNLSLEGGRVKAKGTRAALDLMLGPLRKHRDELLSAMTTLEPKLDPATWHELAHAYQQHHLICKICTAEDEGGKGMRCNVGTALRGKYTG
jgi:hypothetical protein